MRKLLFLLLTALMISTLSGCLGSSQAPPQNAEITFWSPVGVGFDAADTKLVDDFKKAHPYFTVKHESFPYDEFVTKARESLRSKTGADVMLVPGHIVGELAQAGSLAELSVDYVTGLRIDCTEAVLGAYMRGEKCYGIPLSYGENAAGLLVNKASGPDPSRLQTWNGLIDWAKQSGGATGTPSFDFMSKDTLAYTWLSMIVSSGGQYLKDGKPDFNNPVAIDTLTQLASYVTTDALSAATAAAVAPIFDGKALTAPVDLSRLSGQLKASNKSVGEQFDLLAMPPYGDTGNYVFSTGLGFVVNAGASDSVANGAWVFAEYCASADIMLQKSLSGGFIPSRKSVRENPTFTSEMTYLAPVLALLNNTVYVGDVDTETLKQTVYDAVSNMVTKNTTAESAVQAINAALTKPDAQSGTTP